MDIVEELVAERDIRVLVACYPQHADDNAFDAWVELFTADAVLDTGSVKATGHAELREWLVGVQADRPMRHLVSNVAITVDSPTTATGQMDLLLLGEKEGRWVVAATMRYADRYRKVDDNWLFAERVLEARLPPR
jgi:hypothetical protein